MDKRVILAVAGSGKTSYIISKLCLAKRHLILCYTTENYNVLRRGIINKFHCLPSNIHLFSLFSFLYSFCYRPLYKNYAQNGLSFESPPNAFAPDVNKRTKQIHHSRLAKNILKNNLAYIGRMNKYYDFVSIDEVQDFASYDFDWLLSLVKLDKPVIAVGDFYQHTFDSSTSGNKNRNLYSDEQKYLARFEGFHVNMETLSRSYRCPPSVCKFISEKIGIEIESHNNNTADVRFIEDKVEVISIMEDPTIKKLFYNKHYAYQCTSNNWGNCKGSSYEHVCVVLNPTTFKNYKDNSLANLAPATRAKFYVACSRTRGSLYFIEQSKITAYKNGW